MTTSATNTTAPFGSITVYRMVTSFGRVFSTLAEWKSNRTTRLALVSLSDDMLEDVGLSRGDINKVAPGIRASLR